MTRPFSYLRGRRARVISVVLPAGTGLLGLSLLAEADDPSFYALALGLAGTWTAGALAAGPVRPGAPVTEPGARTLAEPVLTGAGTFGLFYAAARLARHNPVLDRAIRGVLRYMDTGPAGLVLLTAALNGVAEEMFFHGTLWDAAGPDHQAVTTAAVYTAATAATRNPALVLSAAVTSVIFGSQRRRSGGVAAPAIAHVVWSVLMLTLLPQMFGSDAGPAASPARTRNGTIRKWLRTR